jgi:hypothetical protein
MWIVADAGYDGQRLALLLDNLPVRLLVRMRSDRVLRRRASAGPRLRRVITGGRGPPGAHGGGCQKSRESPLPREIRVQAIEGAAGDRFGTVKLASAAEHDRPPIMLMRVSISRRGPDAV